MAATTASTNRNMEKNSTGKNAQYINGFNQNPEACLQKLKNV
jgi:hypothetical protein